MAGRPKRDVEVDDVFLRLPKDVLARVARCKGRMEIEEGASLSKTEAFCRILEAGCQVVEHQDTPLAPVGVGGKTPAALSEMSVLSKISNLSEIPDSAFELPGYGFFEDPEEEAMPLHNGVSPVLQPGEDTEQEATRAPGEPGGQVAPATQSIPPHIQAIAQTAAEYDKLSLGQLAQLLYDRNIYRSRDRQSGEEKPVNRGTLQKWLEQARAAGVL